MIPITPEKGPPVPFDSADEQPKTHRDAVAIASNTAEAIAALGGSLDFSDADLQKAANLITGAEKAGTANVPAHITSPSEAAAVSELIRRFDFPAFIDAQQARNFITTKLVRLADCGDAKIEIKALELLGKHSDVGLFTERSEITVHHTTSQGLENSIKERIKRLLNTGGADTVAPSPLDDLDAYLGPKVIIPRKDKTAPTDVEAKESDVRETPNIIPDELGEGGQGE